MSDNQEIVLHQYGDVIDVEAEMGRDAYTITNAKGKQWVLTGEDIANGRKGHAVPRFLVVWTKSDGDTKYMPHTSKPTALGHVRGLQRDPKVEAVAIYPISEDTRAA